MWRTDLVAAVPYQCPVSQVQPTVGMDFQGRVNSTLAAFGDLRVVQSCRGQRRWSLQILLSVLQRENSSTPNTLGVVIFPRADVFLAGTSYVLHLQRAATINLILRLVQTIVFLFFVLSFQLGLFVVLYGYIVFSQCLTVVVFANWMLELYANLRRFILFPASETGDNCKCSLSKMIPMLL